MKNILLSLTVIVLLSACSGGGSNQDLSTPQATIESLFEAIRSDDSSAFMNVVATTEDFRSYAIEANNLQPADKRQSQLQVDQFVESWTKDHKRSLFAKRFTEIRRDGTADGIKDWKETAFSKSSYEPDEQNQLLQRYPKVVFTYGDFIGGVALGAVLVKSSRGWVIAKPGFYENMHYKKMFNKSFFPKRR